MRAIAKWLVFGVPTATEADHGPAGKSKRFALLIHDFKVAFYTDISVVVDGDPGRGHSISEPQRAAHKANHSGTIYKERIPGPSVRAPIMSTLRNDNFAQRACRYIVSIAAYLNLFGQKRLFTDSPDLFGNIVIHVAERVKTQV